MKLLAEATVRRRLEKLRERAMNARKRLEAELADIERCRDEIQARCPHSKTHVESGQYMPCVVICNLCGAEIG